MIQSIERRKLAKALRATKGNMSAAARLLGQDRSVVYRKVQASPELLKLMEEIAEEALDGWEGRLDTFSEKGNVVATLALLNARGARRGFGYHRSEVNVSGQVDHRHLHMHHISGATNPRLVGVEDDELARLIEEKRALLDASPEPSEPMIDVSPRRTALHLPPPADREAPDREG